MGIVYGAAGAICTGNFVQDVGGLWLSDEVVEGRT